MADQTETAGAFAALSAVYDDKAWHRIGDYFTEDCVFTNPFRTIRGRDALREFTAGWPEVENSTVWEAIDGDRVVRGWVERPPGSAARPSYAGVSTWVYASNGLFRSYEGYFDTVAFRAAWSGDDSR